MLMISSIDSYIQAVTNVPAVLGNKDFLENLHPRYTEMLARCNNASGGASPSPNTPIDVAVNTLLETGVNNESGLNKHTIGVVGLLCAKTKTNEFNTNFESFLVQLSGFMETCDWAHMRIVANVVTEIAAAITDQMIRRNQPILGINLLGNLATRLQAHEKMLTCVHSCVLQLCCASYNFKAALRFIIDDFEEFTPDLKSSDNTQSLLSYLYYSGIIYTALKRYDRAIYFFEACTRVPAITLSHIMLECYKKHMLVCLIQHGEVPSPHKSASQVVNRLLKPNALAYTELATAFNVSSDALSNCIAKHVDVYRRDQTYGLVKQVRTAHMRVLIRKLTRTFLTLSLEDVGKRAVGGEAENPERIVLGMIQENMIYAKINQRDGMVRFLDSIVDLNTNHRVMELLEAKINSCVELNKRVGIMNDRISTNPEFISKVVLDNATGVQDGDQAGSSGGGATGGGATGGGNQQISSSGKFQTRGSTSSNSNVAGAFNL